MTEPKAWHYLGPDGEDFVRSVRDVGHNWLKNNGWKETELVPKPTDQTTRGREAYISKLELDIKTVLDREAMTILRYDNKLNEKDDRIAEFTDILYKIRRAAELSADIMRNPQRTGGWVGAERTARAFDRLADHAKKAEAIVNVKMEQGDAEV